MLRGNPYVSTTLSVLASVLAVSGIVYAATTIGTNVTVDGTLTQTGAAAFAAGVNASSTLLVTGAVTHYGNSTFGDAATDVNLFTGTLQASTTALFTSGLTTYAASTLGATTTATGLKVGGSGTTFIQLVAGFCNIPDTTVAASTTAYANCTSATGIAAGDRVFVMATGSLTSSVVIKAATSTANDTINVAILNTTNVSTTTDNISFNFWAFK